MLLPGGGWRRREQGTEGEGREIGYVSLSVRYPILDKSLERAGKGFTNNQVARAVSEWWMVYPTHPCEGKGEASGVQTTLKLLYL